ncbi:MAG: class I SAM-dependent methyltransferase [Anaerolineaceae bacterium]|nr:class I SAM-dependent methyltransferase [Anaerolineaceae bacterium]
MKMTNFEKIFVNNPFRSWQVSHYAEKMLKRTDFKIGQTYLDFGCGNGAAAINLATKYPLKITGIDVDLDQIRLAQQAGRHLANVRFIPVDGTRLPFDDGEFDIVYTNKVTHHIPNWLEAVAEMTRVVKPGGYLIYADLIVPSWLAQLGRRVMKQTGFPTGDGLEMLFRQRRLHPIYTAITPVHYEVVLHKV